jgi:thiamine-phosphate pyrophosphorylase
MKRFDLSLYLVLDPGLCEPIGMIETARRAVAGGASMVQLRHKTASTAQIIDIGRALKAALAGSGVSLVVNDNIEAALAMDADGVHVGQQDMNAELVRERIGGEKILGLSIGTDEDAAALRAEHIDYVGIGPIFPTETKPGHSQAIGLEGLKRLARAVRRPAVAIGGLKIHHVKPVLESGAAGLAVVSAICGQPDPEQAARAMAAEFRRMRS